MYDNVNFINIESTSLKMDFTTEKSFALEIPALLQSDELFRECPVHFLGLTLAAQLNHVYTEQSESYAFYHCRVCNQQNRFDQSSSATSSEMTKTSFCSETLW